MNCRLFFPKPPALCSCPQREAAGSLTGGQLVIFMPLPDPYDGSHCPIAQAGRLSLTKAK